MRPIQFGPVACCWCCSFFGLEKREAELRRIFKRDLRFRFADQKERAELKN